ncbi:hypothetical protein ACKVEX_13980 [Rhodocyclaceae bacterium SMB388]
MTITELAISAVTPPTLGWAHADASTRMRHWFDIVEDAPLAHWLARFELTHLYLGSEFCEHLLPSAHTLRRGLARAAEAGLQLALLTPVASPQVVRQLAELLPMLPEHAEVVVNDWGVAALLAESHTGLRPIAGRILCRMIKDPRLSGEKWAPQCAPAVDSGPRHALLQRLGLTRIELDMPMFADLHTFSDLPCAKGVHLPYAYVAKGRMCRPGSMSLSGSERFAVGRKCRKECLSLSAVVERPGADDPHATVQLGNTVFSRHTDGMLRVLMSAADQGAIERVIVPGERL